MAPSNRFGWADDSSGPIDTTPAGLPRPPDALIEAAARAVPPILANVDPTWHYAEVSAVASSLTGALVKQAHTLQAACWAVNRLVGEGKLLAKPAYDPIPMVISQTKTVGGGHSVRPIPEGKPAPFSAFRVVATDALWAWWRSLGGLESGSTGKRRGRRKADYQTVQREAQLAAEWERARDTGVYKADFASDKKMKLKQFNALLNRVRKRKDRSDK